MSTRVVFIVSLPRSGSTLLQKMLSTSPDVASAAEPWIMLPFWGMRQPSAGRTVYFHHTAANAINEFIHNIPDGETAFVHAVGQFAQSLYTAAAADKPVFIDKTPRYYLMLPFLQRALPDAKFILLLRNPLAVLASICETFNRGRFMWFEYWLDWLEGHHCLANAVRESAPNQYLVRYEDLVLSPAEVLQPLCKNIGIEYNNEMVSGYKAVLLPGRMGDPSGIHNYQSISKTSVTKWQSFFDTAYRRSVAEKMLARIDPRDLDALGYSMHTLIDGLHAGTLRKGIDMRSRLDNFIGSLAHVVDYRYLQARWRAYIKGESYAYGYYRAI